MAVNGSVTHQSTKGRENLVFLKGNFTTLKFVINLAPSCTPKKKGRRGNQTNQVEEQAFNFGYGSRFDLLSS